MGLKPVYSNKGNINRLQFDVKGYSDNRILTFAGFIFAAMLIGILGKIFIPEGIRMNVNNIVLSPVYDLFLKMLSIVSGPLIFLSVTWGIYGIGDTSSLNQLGKTFCASFIRNTLFVCLCGLVFVSVFDLNYSSVRMSQSPFGDLINMVFGCVPRNIIEPFYTGNTLQILFLAVVNGITLLYLGELTSSVARAVEQIKLLLQRIMESVSKLVPGIIVIVIISLFWSGTLDVVKEAWKFFLLLIIGAALTVTVFTIIISVKYRIRPSVFLEKCLPTFVIALLTASSSATFESTVSICKNKLGIDSSVTGFAVPLGMVMHNPIAAINNLLVVLFFSEIYGIECNYVTLLTAVFCSSILAIASPPIPGGGIIVYSMLFTQFGIPLEGVAVISAIDLATDFIITSTEMLCLFPGIILASDRVGKLDIKTLQKIDKA